MAEGLRRRHSSPPGREIGWSGSPSGEVSRAHYTEPMYRCHRHGLFRSQPAPIAPMTRARRKSALEPEGTRVLLSSKSDNPRHEIAWAHRANARLAAARRLLLGSKHEANQ